MTHIHISLDRRGRHTWTRLYSKNDCGIFVSVHLGLWCFFPIRIRWVGVQNLPCLRAFIVLKSSYYSTVMYFDQLLVAARTKKLFETFFSAIFQPFSFFLNLFQWYLTTLNFSTNIKITCQELERSIILLFAFKSRDEYRRILNNFWIVIVTRDIFPSLLWTSRHKCLVGMDTYVLMHSIYCTNVLAFFRPSNWIDQL